MIIVSDLSKEEQEEFNDAQMKNTSNEEWENNEVNTDALQNEENWPDEADVRPIYNDAQMINGTFEGDTISQKGKQRLKQPKKGLNTDSDNPDSGE